MKNEGLTVGILRPPLLSRVQEEQQKHEPTLSVAQSRWVEIVERRIAEIRELFEIVSDQLSTRLHLTEHQLFNQENGMPPLGRRRARLIAERDVLVAIDPTPVQYNFVTIPRQSHPLQRAVIAYTDSGAMQDSISLFSAGRVQLLYGTEKTAIQRVFTLLIPLEDGQAADLDAQHRQTISKVILYPDIPFNISAYNPAQLLDLDQDHPLSGPGGREYL